MTVYTSSPKLSETEQTPKLLGKKGNGYLVSPRKLRQGIAESCSEDYSGNFAPVRAESQIVIKNDELLRMKTVIKIYRLRTASKPSIRLARLRGS